MSLEFKIVGDTGRDTSKRQVHIHPFKTATGVHSGLVVLSQKFIETEPSTTFFVNDTVGIAMNQDVSFGSIASVIHDGGTTTSADTGTADTNTVNKLIQAGQNFTSTVVVGMSVHNTTDDTYGNVTAVDSDTSLSLDSDVFPDGNEAFIINAVWVGTAVQGTWNFADGGKITLTGGDNNDQASIVSDTVALWDMDNFTAFTGKIDLDTYVPATQDISIQFNLNGVLVGNSILLNDFIDTGNFAEQSFVIPKALLGLSSQNINGLTITLSRTGGAKPSFKFDDLQLEASGIPLVFSLNVDPGNRFHIQELVFAYRDNITSITTVTGATENVTNHALDVNTILGLSALTNGFVIRRQKAGKTLFSATIKTLGGHMSAGALPDVPLTAPDGSSTFIVLRAKFEDPLILTGDADDTLTITINDNMSGLLQFTVSGRGGLEAVS